VTRKDALELLQLNQTLYKQKPCTMTAEEVNAAAMVWEWQFKDYDYNVIKRAFLMAVRACKYQVTIADVVEQLNAIQPSYSPESLWQGLMGACDKAQRYLPWRSCPMIIGIDEDGKTIKSNGQNELDELYNGLPTVTKRYLGSVSALVDLARDGTNDYRRSEFIRYIDSQPQSVMASTMIGAGRAANEPRLEAKK